MNFTFETQYDQKSFTVMARVLRKTVRKKKNKRTHVVGWLVILLALLLMFADGFHWDMRTAITMLAVFVMMVTLIWEDQINGWLGKKRLLEGLKRSVVVFKEDCYSSETELGKSEFTYDKISTIAETEDYFIFVFDKLHGQVYDKAHLSGGTVEEFRRFIQDKTGKELQNLK